MSQIKAAFGAGYKIKVGITDDTFSKYTDQFDVHLPTEEEVEPYREMCRELFAKHGITSAVELQKFQDREDATEFADELVDILAQLSDVVFKDLDPEDVKLLRTYMNTYDRILFNQHLAMWINYRSCF